MQDFPTEPEERFANWHARKKIKRKDRSGSFSGSGSSLEQTAIIRSELPKLVRKLNVLSILDAPCGDFFWMKSCDLSGIHYVGVDIIKDVIDRNRAAYATKTKRFDVRDIITDPLPASDLILCRDCLVHLSFAQAFEVLRNFKASASRYLLTTTFTGRTRNSDLTLKTQFWRPLNLQAPPFDFPPPETLIVERCTELDGTVGDKSLALWNLRALPV